MIPKFEAIVKAAAIEQSVQCGDPSLVITILMCGHCGKLNRETRTFDNSDPNECEMSNAAKAAREIAVVCDGCRVKNVSQPVERYLREEQRCGPTSGIFLITT